MFQLNWAGMVNSTKRACSHFDQTMRRRHKTRVQALDRALAIKSMASRSQAGIEQRFAAAHSVHYSSAERAALDYVVDIALG